MTSWARACLQCSGEWSVCTYGRILPFVAQTGGMHVSRDLPDRKTASAWSRFCSLIAHNVGRNQRFIWRQTTPIFPIDLRYNSTEKNRRMYADLQLNNWRKYLLILKKFNIKELKVLKHAITPQIVVVICSCLTIIIFPPFDDFPAITDQPGRASL